MVYMDKIDDSSMYKEIDSSAEREQLGGIPYVWKNTM